MSPDSVRPEMGGGLRAGSLKRLPRLSQNSERGERSSGVKGRPGIPHLAWLARSHEGVAICDTVTGRTLTFVLVKGGGRSRRKVANQEFQRTQCLQADPWDEFPSLGQEKSGDIGGDGRHFGEIEPLLSVTVDRTHVAIAWYCGLGVEPGLISTD